MAKSYVDKVREPLTEYLPEESIYLCECKGRPKHGIPGMTTDVYHSLTLKYGTKYLIQAHDCDRPLSPGVEIVEQTEVYRVVGPTTAAEVKGPGPDLGKYAKAPSKFWDVTFRVRVRASSAANAEIEAAGILESYGCGGYIDDVVEVEE